MSKDIVAICGWSAVGPLFGAAIIVLTDPAGLMEIAAVGLISAMMTAVALKGVET